MPISNISTSDLFEEVTLDLGTLSEFDSNAASIYSVEDFTYTEGKEIPIILNSNSFATTYEDWGGETEIVMDFQELRRDRQAGPPDPQEEEANNPFPIKTKSIEYSRSDLLGKTITIEFGGLDSINTYTIEQEDGVRKFVKLTDEEVQALLTERQSVISEYWNYEKISTPLTYTFKVVGIIDEGNASYIPSNFANKVMSDYIDNQLGALQKDITDDLLDSTFLGLSYDGTEFSSTSGFGLGREMPGGGMGMGRPQEISSTEDSYNIPGLVIKTASDGSSDVEGMVTDKEAYSTAVKSSPYITMKIDSIYSRDSVINAINEAGYAVQDNSDFEIFGKIQSTLSKISIIFSISFIALIILVVFITTLKFVSESRKEIGIFRAIGMRKSTILSLFTGQAVLYTIIACVAGIVCGVSVNVLAGGYFNNIFSNFAGETIKQSFDVVVDVDASMFRQVNYILIAIYTGILFLTTFLIALIPAYKASKVSPVEAIRGE